jgi:hypothetical protein
MNFLHLSIGTSQVVEARKKLQLLDAQVEQVFVILAHDENEKDVIDFFRKVRITGKNSVGRIELDGCSWKTSVKRFLAIPIRLINRDVHFSAV